MAGSCAIRLLSVRNGNTQDIKYERLSPLTVIDWSFDGMGLFAGINAANGSAELLHIDLHGNTQSLWTTTYGFTWGIPSRDGRHLAIEGGTQDRNAWMLEKF